MNSSHNITSMYCSELVISTTESFHNWILIVHVHVEYMYVHVCVLEWRDGGVEGDFFLFFYLFYLASML